MYLSINAMKKLNKAAGQHWFSKETMEFFQTKIEHNFGEYFITSEQCDPDFPRKYTIRKFDPVTCKVDTVGSFQEYDTVEEAKQAVSNLLLQV
jgi:hypothetical protein